MSEVVSSAGVVAGRRDTGCAVASWARERAKNKKINSREIKERDRQIERRE